MRGEGNDQNLVKRFLLTQILPVVSLAIANVTEKEIAFFDNLILNMQKALHQD
jgi:hypothetical protein